MTQLSTTFKNELAKLLAHNEAIAGFGDASGLQPSAAEGNLYLRLCTDAVVVDDDTIGTECAFTGYTSGGIALARGSGNDLDVTTNVVSNANNIEVVADAGYGGSEDVKFAELWLDNSSSTESKRISHCQLSQTITMVAGKTFRISAGSLTFTID
jgi:hypothetical protein